MIDWILPDLFLPLPFGIDMAMPLWSADWIQSGLISFALLFLSG